MQWGWAKSSLNINYGPPPSILTHNKEKAFLEQLSAITHAFATSLVWKYLYQYSFTACQPNPFFNSTVIKI